MFTLTKEAAIQKNLPENRFGTCQWTGGIFWTPRRVVGLDDLNGLIDARLNTYFVSIII